MDMVLKSVREALVAAWRFHFVIPEPAYWLVIVVAGVGFTAATTTEAIAWTGILAIGVQGLVRWRYHRGRGRRALVLARFAGPVSEAHRAVEAQQHFLTRLRDNLSPGDASTIHAVPAVVGTADSAGAARLRRRLRARLLVYGRVTDDVGGGWAVFARLITSVGSATHLDEHTRDATPIKRTWGERVELLSPTERVLAEEYPLLAAAELECLVRGSAGQVALLLGDPERAEILLREALAIVPDSDSPAIDGLRVALAESLADQNKLAQALVVLRARSSADNVSPDLLRYLHRVLGFAAVGGLEDSKAARQESIAALRKAIGNRADPQRDMSQFNLTSLLRPSDDPADRQEAVALLRDLEANSPHYSRAWYVQRLLGSVAWSKAEAAAAAGDTHDAAQYYRDAGRRYGKAIRLRPRVSFFVWVGPRRILWTRHTPAAILRANLADVHDALRRVLRSRWQWWRCERTRNTLMRRGFKRFAEGQWERAYANFDWAYVGREDFKDMVAQVYSAVAAWQLGDDDEALPTWHAVVSKHRFALFTRAAMLRDPANHPLERGLPGDDSTDLNEIAAMLGVPRPGPGSLPAFSSSWRTRLFPGHERTRGM
jgi:tetratricopeptide (TPR) repeat protein